MTPEEFVEERSDSFVNARLAALLLMALPILMNAIALFPEVRYGVPSDNDQIFHYLFVERANQAIAAGDNPVDHWLPELELGFAQFHYYQNLPHLMVVAIYHLMLERVSLFTTLNVIRYLLMVLFPLTVYWSLRRMEFSMVAAAVGAAFCSTLSSWFNYGFDYYSYNWGGFGMFPQLCSMHLMFIGIACLRTVLRRGEGYAAAIIAASAMVLSDLLYGYIFGIMAAVLLLLSISEQLAGNFAHTKSFASRVAASLRVSASFAVVTFTAMIITAYQTIPFLLQLQYLNRSARPMPRDFFTGVFKVSTLATLWKLLGGNAYDAHRLPVVTTLVFLGILYGAITRSGQAKLALSLMVSFFFLIIAPIAMAGLVNLLPLWRLVPPQRLVSQRDFAAILLAALGGEFIWSWWPSHKSRTRALGALAILLALCIMALPNRWAMYGVSGAGIQATAQALQDDTDLPQVFAALKKAPRGRVYAGTRANWGRWMEIGPLRLYDLLPIEQFDTVMPWQTLSQNALYLWHLNTPSPKQCRLFNIRYVIAPPNLGVPKSYSPILNTSRYTLYQADSGGYMQLGQIGSVQPMTLDRAMLHLNDTWIDSDGPTEGNFIAYRSEQDKFQTNPDDELTRAVATSQPDQDNAQLGTIENEIITPDSMSAHVTATTSALLVIKVTYHPNWHVTIDGHEQHTFMVSPSYIGTMIAPGQHQVNAEYRSSQLKKLLIVIGCITLIALVFVHALGLETRAVRLISD